MDNDIMNEELMKEMANLVLETLDTTIDESQDPAGYYLQQLSSHFHNQNPRMFRSRFVRGYKLLLEELIR